MASEYARRYAALKRQRAAREAAEQSRSAGEKARAAVGQIRQAVQGGTMPGVADLAPTAAPRLARQAERDIPLSPRSGENRTNLSGVEDSLQTAARYEAAKLLARQGRQEELFSLTEQRDRAQDALDRERTREAVLRRMGGTASSPERQAAEKTFSDLSSRRRALKKQVDEDAYQEQLEQGFREMSLWDATVGSAKRGFFNTRYGQELWHQMLGGESEAGTYKDILDRDEYRYTTLNPVKKAVSGAAELLGQQFRQYTDPRSVAMGGTAAVAASLAGKAGPQALLPEEVITVPGAFMTGMAMGGAVSNVEIEGGLAYQEMVDNGVSHETARNIAAAVGGVNGILEFMQADELLKSFRILSRNPATYGAARKLGEVLANHGLRVGNETLQEVAQEAVTIGGNQLGTYLESGRPVYSQDEVLDRLKETALSSALSFGILGAPGAGAQVYQTAARSAANTRQTGAWLSGMGEDVTRAVVREGLDSAPDTRSYALARQLRDRLDRGETVSDRQLGRLYQANVETIAEEERESRGRRGAHETPALQEQEDRTRKDSPRRAAEGREGEEDTHHPADSRTGHRGAETAELGVLEDSLARRGSIARSDALSPEGGTEDISMPGISEVQRRANLAAPDVLSPEGGIENILSPRISEEQRQANLARLERVDDTLLTRNLGERGARVARRFYTGAQSADSYLRGFRAMYRAGVSGLEQGMVPAELAGSLTAPQRQAAWLAGQADAQAALEEERGRVRFATVYGQEAGVVGNDYARGADQAQIAALDRVAKAVGIKLQVVDGLEHGAEGRILSSGVIELSARANNPLLVVAGHEITHRMQELAPEEYRAYRDYVVSRLMERDGGDGLDELMDRYDRAGVELTTQEAMDEAAAEYAEDMIRNEALFRDLAREHRSAAQKFLDAVKEFIRKVRAAFRGEKQRDSAAMDAYGVDMDTLEQAAKLWQDAFDAAQRQAQEGQKNTAHQTEESGETRYSLKEYGPEQIKNWAASKSIVVCQSAAQFRQFVQDAIGGRNLGKKLYLGAIPADLAARIRTDTGVDVEGYNCALGANEIRKIFKDHGREQTEDSRGQRAITADDILSIQEIIQAPDTIRLSKKLYNGKPAIEFVKTVNGRTTIVTYVSDKHRDLTVQTMYSGRKKEGLATPTGEQAPVNTPEAGSGTVLDSSIPQTGEEVNDRTRFSLKSPVEETKTLVALHNLTAEKLEKALNLGGFPMPSIAVTRSDIPHTNFWDITLIFGRETVDPKADRRNTVYSADAWTPTFPNTEYEADGKVVRRLSDKFYDLYRKYGREAVEALYPWGNYAEEQLNREGGEDAAIARLRDSAGMMKVYLLDSGMQVPETVMKETVTRLDDREIRQFDYLIKGLGREVVDELAPAGDETPMAARRRWMAAHGEALEEVYLGYQRDIRGLSEAEIKKLTESQSFSKKVLLRIITEARRYLVNGPETRSSTVDGEATRRAIVEATDQEAYQAWLRKTFGGIEKSSGIYNGKERYTSSGNLRSFKATHLPVTLENIAKAMAAQGDGDSRNVSGFYGVKSLRAGMAARFSSVADMHRLEGRLKHLTEEEAEQISDALGDRLSAAMEKVYATKPHGEYDNQLIAFDSIGEILMDACRAKKVTVDSIIKAFSGTGYKIGTPLAAELRDLLFDIGEMPVNIFEAKPERAVGFDEVLAAVVPADTDQALLDRLEQAGVETITYQTDSETDRLEKVNSVADARFSLPADRDSLTALRRENKRLRERVERWKGQLQRTENGQVDPRSVELTAKQLIAEYSAQLKPADIAGDLLALYNYMGTGRDGENELTYPEARLRAEDIARRLVDSALETEDEMYREYQGLREHFRDIELTLSQADWDSMDGVNELRRHNMGRVVIGKGRTNVDMVYKELGEMWPEFFDENRELTIQEQLWHISEVLDSVYSVTSYNPFSWDAEQAAAFAANEIMELYWDQPNVRKTFADRQADKLERTREQGRERVRRVREEKNQRIEEVREQDRERARQAIERVRQKRDEQLQRLKDHYARVRADTAARRADSKARTRLLHIVRRLRSKKLPAANRAMLDAYIGELDTAAKSMTGKTLRELTELRQWYEDQKRNDPDFIPDPAIEERLKRLERRQINDLSAGEVAELTEVLLHIENELANEKKLIDTQDRRDTYHMAEQVIQDVQDSGGNWGPLKPLDDLLITGTLSPVRQARRMTGWAPDDPLVARMNELADGQRAMLDYQMKAQRPFQSFARDKKFSRRFAGPDAETVSITGMTAEGERTVEITPAMRVSLYLHSLNPQNLRHIRDGGIKVPDMKYYRRGDIAHAYDRGVILKLTPSQVRAITRDMTAEEKRFAGTARKYFNETSREAINAVSEKLKGYSIAQVEDYYPIHSDTSFTRAGFDALKFDGTIEGMGFLKDREVKASNPILLRDANAEVEQSIQMHGKYVGLAIPVRNFNKVWGVTTGSFNADGMRSAYESSVQHAVKQTWGEEGYKYIERLMSNLQGGRKSNGDLRALDRLRSSYAGAVLTLNASVAMKQAASYPTAAAVLGWKPLARAMGDFGRVDLELIAKYTPLQWYRSLGFSDKELGDLKAAGRALPPVLNWVQGADLLTTRKLWKASEYYVRDHNRALAWGSDAYYRAVADIYNRVIEETQPNYTAMQRPHLLRSDDSIVQSILMFKTQPFQNFNIVYDAVGAWRAAEQRKTGQAEARRNLGRAVTSQLAQLAVFAGMTMAWAMFRGRKRKYEDEEGELTAGSITKALLKDMAGGALASVPGGAEGWEALDAKFFGGTAYGVNVVSVEAAAELVSGLNSMGDTVWKAVQAVRDGKELDPHKLWLELDPHISAVSKAAGVPYENVVNLVKATVRNTCVQTLGKYRGEYAALRMFSDPEKDSGEYFDLLYRAMRKDRGAYEAICADMQDRKLFDRDTGEVDENGEKVITGTKDRLKSAMESRMMDSQGVRHVDELEKRWLPPAAEREFDAVMEGLTGDRLWDRASQDQRDRAEKQLYTLEWGGEPGEKIREKIDGGRQYGLDETEYLLFRLALSMADQPSKNGNLGSYTNAERQEAIEMLTGLNDGERSYLWSVSGGKDSSDPWGRGDR